METVEMSQPRRDLCLDFSNTIDWRNGSNAKDSLTDFESLVRWSVKAGVLGDREAGWLVRAATERNLSAATLRRALELRETIYRIFSAVARDKDPDERDIRALNRFLSDSDPRSKVVRRGREFGWGWDVNRSPQDQILWPVARSAADLLTSDQLGRVKECANEDEGCGWVFMDKTKSKTRRWCSMSGCGNRAKARTWYDRHSRAKGSK